jgi:hypothetical protein
MSEVRIDPTTGMNELQALPDDVQAILDAHKLQYQTDPAGARMWDPIVMGVPGGPVKCLLLTYTGRKSGKTLQTVLQYYDLGDKVAVVGSRRSAQMAAMRSPGRSAMTNARNGGPPSVTNNPNSGSMRKGRRG